MQRRRKSHGMHCLFLYLRAVCFLPQTSHSIASKRMCVLKRLADERTWSTHLLLFRYWGVVSEPPELPRSELMDENGGRCSQAAHTLLHYRDHIPKCWKNFSRQTHPEFPRRFITQKWGVARDSLRAENWIVMCSSFRTLTRPCL